MLGINDVHSWKQFFKGQHKIIQDIAKSENMYRCMQWEENRGKSLRLGACDNMNYKFNFKIIKLFWDIIDEDSGDRGGMSPCTSCFKNTKIHSKKCPGDIIFIFVSSTKHVYFFCICLFCPWTLTRRNQRDRTQNAWRKGVYQCISQSSGSIMKHHIRSINFLKLFKIPLSFLTMVKSFHSSFFITQ